MFYKIILKPIGDFYFGGENSFGKSKKDMSKKEAYFSKTGYFAKGEMFPQQTHVLGMLRRTILRKHGFMKLHKNGEWVNNKKFKEDEAQTIVGKKWEEDLGKIISISTVQLEREDAKKSILFYPAPYDYEMTLNKQKGISYINGREDKNNVYAFKVGHKDFDAKSSLCYNYISKDAQSIALDELFVKKTRIGNQTYMSTNKNDDDEQLYKMTSYIFNEAYKDIHFVCYMETKDETVWKTKEYHQTVELGGERSIFSMTVSEVQEIPNSKEVYIKNQKKQTRLVLTSDAYVESNTENIFDNVEVALAHKLRFRSIDNSKNNHFSKSSKKILLKKGSVFYPKDDGLAKIITMLENQIAFRNIGYNQYVIIDKKEQ